MCEYAEYALKRAGPPTFPKGYNSRPQDCPLCTAKPKGRRMGLLSHIRDAHGLTTREAQRLLNR